MVSLTPFEGIGTEVSDRVVSLSEVARIGFVIGRLVEAMPSASERLVLTNGVLDHTHVDPSVRRVLADYIELGRMMPEAQV